MIVWTPGVMSVFRLLKQTKVVLMFEDVPLLEEMEIRGLVMEVVVQRRREDHCWGEDVEAGSEDGGVSNVSLQTLSPPPAQTSPFPRS